MYLQLWTFAAVEVRQLPRPSSSNDGRHSSRRRRRDRRHHNTRMSRRPLTRSWTYVEDTREVHYAPAK